MVFDENYIILICRTDLPLKVPLAFLLFKVLIALYIIKYTPLTFWITNPLIGRLK